MNRTYQIDPRPVELGGGVFPPEVTAAEPDFDAAYQDALDEGESWSS